MLNVTKYYRIYTKSCYLKYKTLVAYIICNRRSNRTLKNKVFFPLSSFDFYVNFKNCNKIEMKFYHIFMWISDKGNKLFWSLNVTNVDA